MRRYRNGGGSQSSGDRWVDVVLTSNATPISASGATPVIAATQITVAGVNDLLTTNHVVIPYTVALPGGIRSYSAISLRLKYNAAAGSLLDSTGMKAIGVGIQPDAVTYANGIYGLIQKDTTNWRIAAFSSAAAISNVVVTGSGAGVACLCPLSPDGLREHLLACTVDADNKPTLTQEMELAGTGVVSSTLAVAIVISRTAAAGALDFQGLSFSYKLHSR